MPTNCDAHLAESIFQTRSSSADEDFLIHNVYSCSKRQANKIIPRYLPKCAPQGLRRKVHRNRLPLQASESFHLHRWYFFAW
ncbi:DUF6783 domain-containing protein [Blautia wexlerae]|uniref:DUF6783 domain-containing protein n=1 Tax=Blautia wexlerae TaxID=418240 RepID=UPI0034A57E09